MLSARWNRVEQIFFSSELILFLSQYLSEWFSVRLSKSDPQGFRSKFSDYMVFLRQVQNGSFRWKRISCSFLCAMFQPLISQIFFVKYISLKAKPLSGVDISFTQKSGSYLSWSFRNLWGYQKASPLLALVVALLILRVLWIYTLNRKKFLLICCGDRKVGKYGGWFTTPDRLNIFGTEFQLQFFQKRQENVTFRRIAYSKKVSASAGFRAKLGSHFSGVRKARMRSSDTFL